MPLWNIDCIFVRCHAGMANTAGTWGTRVLQFHVVGFHVYPSNSFFLMLACLPGCRLPIGLMSSDTPLSNENATWTSWTDARGRREHLFFLHSKSIQNRKIQFISLAFAVSFFCFAFLFFFETDTWATVRASHSAVCFVPQSHHSCEIETLWECDRRSPWTPTCFVLPLSAVAT